MDDTSVLPPARFDELVRLTDDAAFPMASKPRTGSLLRTLAATKPGGNLLELGTGTGVGTAWLLDGMDSTARLTTVESEVELSGLARKVLGTDARVNFVTGDAEKFILEYQGPPFDLVFADCQAGKFRALDQLVELLVPGALYISDDLLPQPAWDTVHPNHQECVDYFLDRVRTHPQLRPTVMNWCSGLLVAART